MIVWRRYYWLSRKLVRVCVCVCCVYRWQERDETLCQSGHTTRHARATDGRRLTRPENRNAERVCVYVCECVRVCACSTVRRYSCVRVCTYCWLPPTSARFSPTPRPLQRSKRGGGSVDDPARAFDPSFGPPRLRPLLPPVRDQDDDDDVATAARFFFGAPPPLAPATGCLTQQVCRRRICHENSYRLRETEGGGYSDICNLRLRPLSPTGCPARPFSPFSLAHLSSSAVCSPIGRYVQIIIILRLKCTNALLLYKKTSKYAWKKIEKYILNMFFIVISEWKLKHALKNIHNYTIKSTYKFLKLQSYIGQQ